MRLHLRGELRDLHHQQQLEPVRSAHTGQDLRRVELEFQAAERHVDELLRELQDARDPEHALVDEDGARWLVGNHTNSYRDGDGSRRFTVELRQVESLQVERLELPGLTLQPIYFDEDAEGDGIIIIVEADPEGADAEELERRLLAVTPDNIDYFPIVRVGISDEPVLMRWGRCLWQDLPDGRKRHQLALVSKDVDDANDKPPALTRIGEPRLSNASRIALYARELAEALVDELQGSRVLSDAAAGRLRERALASWDRNFRELSRTDDVTQYR